MLLKFMIKLVMLSLLLTGCSISIGSKPTDKIQFHYGDQIVITGGFYKGLSGRVESMGNIYSDCERMYEVYNGSTGTIKVCNSDLELIK